MGFTKSDPPLQYVHFYLNSTVETYCLLRMPVELIVLPSRECARSQKEFTRECAELFAEIVHFFGVPKSVGQIYGVLYASPVSLSFSDIVDRIDISKGSASQGLQVLRILGAVKVVPALKVTGADRLKSAPKTPLREYYEPELGLRKLLGGVLREKLAPLATTGSRQLSRIQRLAEQDDIHQRFFQERASQLITWQSRIKKVIPILDVLLGRPK